jgi:hypothetical protein
MSNLPKCLVRYLSDHFKGTRKVGAYFFEYNPDCTVFLIDTPGFDDTSCNDTEALKELSSWLTEPSSNSLKLDGIILLHRVDDVRMRDWAKRNIEVFQKLCRPDVLNVILCTTMWDRVTDEEGSQRESELVSTSEFWGWMKSQGSKVCRYDGDRATALGLVEHFVRKKSQVGFEVSHQMVEDKKDLNETSAALLPEVELIKGKYPAKMMKLSKDTDELKRGIRSLHGAKNAEMMEKIRGSAQSSQRGA